MKTFAFTFTEQQLQILDLALKDMPYKLAAPLIHEINLQISQQQEKPINQDGIPDEIKSFPN